MSDKNYPCPACGHVVFSEPPGSNDICLVCFWEDDIDQLRSPQLADRANYPSLVEAQKNVARFGAIEQRFAGDVREPAADEPIDPEWRPVLPNDVFEAVDESAPAPEDPTQLYYWRRNLAPSPKSSN